MSVVALSRWHPHQVASRMLAWRPTLSTEALALWASLYFVLAGNVPFWRAVFATGALQGAPGAFAAACLMVLVFALQAFLFCVLLHGRLARPVLALLLLAGAAANHYMGAYGIYFDTDMVRNVLHTDVREARELLAWSLLPALVAYAGPPCSCWPASACGSGDRHARRWSGLVRCWPWPCSPPAVRWPASRTCRR